MPDLAAVAMFLVGWLGIVWAIDRRWPRDPRRCVTGAGGFGLTLALVLGAFAPSQRLLLFGMVATGIGMVAATWIAMRRWPNDLRRRQAMLFAVMIGALVGMQLLAD